MSNVCKHCDQEETAHHEFVPADLRDMPAGCVCDPRAWVLCNIVHPICDSYGGNGKQYCVTCEHESACHKPAP